MYEDEDEDERGYCSDCFTNLDDDEYDYRYEYPLCLKCGANHEDELSEGVLNGDPEED